MIRCDSNQVGSLTAGTRCEEPLLSLHGVDRGRGTSDDEDLVYFCMRRAGNTTSDFLATLYCLGLGSMDLKIDSKKGTVPVLDPRLGVLVHSEFSEMLVSYTWAWNSPAASSLSATPGVICNLGASFSGYTAVGASGAAVRRRCRRLGGRACADARGRVARCSYAKTNQW